MKKSEDTWTIVHDLALIYVALAYGTDHDLDDAELDTITASLEEWGEQHLPEGDVREVVLEAMAVFLREDAGVEVIHSIETLARVLTEEERQQVLRDVVRIAEADGVLLSSEQSLIGALAAAWRIKATERRLLDATTAAVEALPAWSLFHDLSLVYVVVAHSTDDELSEPELQAIIERLREWQPDLEETDARRILREVLQYYAGEPGEKALGKSIGAIKEALPSVQRLVVLDDLHYIAHVDGAFSGHERAMIDSLAEAWDVPVHTNGRA